MAAVKALALQSISKVVRDSESSETAYNLESYDESSCNSNVDIFDLLISETTREPENSFLADCKVDNLTIPPTLYDHSSDVCKYFSNTDLKAQVVEMPPTVNFDIRDLNSLNTLSGKENSIVANNAIDDLLSTLTIEEQTTCIESRGDSIESNLVNFLGKNEVKRENIDDSSNEVSISHGQQKSCDPPQVSSLSLATLAQHHFRENQFDSIREFNKMPDKENRRECCSVKNEVKELISHDEDLGISLSALAESYLKNENVSSCIPSHSLLVKNDSEQTGDLDILSFISLVDGDGTEEDMVKPSNCSKETLNSTVKQIENCVFSELFETKQGSGDGCDYNKLSLEADSNYFSSQQALSKKKSSQIEELDILSFINSVSVIEEDSANCSAEILSPNVKRNENSDQLLATEESSDEGYDSGKLSPGIDLNNCLKRPITPSPIFKTSLLSDVCSVLPPQDDRGNLEPLYVSTAKTVNENLPHSIPKPSLVNTKQSLFSKALSCKYKQQNEKTLEKVSDIKNKLFEKYFCRTEQDILCEVPISKKKFFDKSTESVITSGYLHLSALPSDNC